MKIRLNSDAIRRVVLRPKGKQEVIYPYQSITPAASDEWDVAPSSPRVRVITVNGTAPRVAEEQ